MPGYVFVALSADIGSRPATAYIYTENAMLE